MRGIAQRTRYATLGILIFSLAASLAGLAQPTDPLIGVWVIDIAKSEWDPAFPIPYRAFTVAITKDKVGYHLDSDVIWADGHETRRSNLWRYDGAETPWNGTPGVTSQFQRINQSTYQFVLRTDGIIRAISRGTLAPDGLSRRHVVLGFNADGTNFRNVEVFRRK